jgi:hypothetical protein
MDSAERNENIRSLVDAERLRGPYNLPGLVFRKHNDGRMYVEGPGKLFRSLFPDYNPLVTKSFPSVRMTKATF